MSFRHRLGKCMRDEAAGKAVQDRPYHVADDFSWGAGRRWVLSRDLHRPYHVVDDFSWGAGRRWVLPRHLCLLLRTDVVCVTPGPSRVAGVEDSSGHLSRDRDGVSTVTPGGLWSPN